MLNGSPTKNCHYIVVCINIVGPQLAAFIYSYSKKWSKEAEEWLDVAAVAYNTNIAAFLLLLMLFLVLYYLND